MNSGCICCSLVGDFGTALREVVSQYSPDRIIIEPSGVGKLSDVIKAVQKEAENCDLSLNSFVTVADAKKCRMYMKNFGEFYNNQIEYAGTVILSRTGQVKEDKLGQAVGLIREHNHKAAVITTPWEQLDGEKILSVMEEGNQLEKQLFEEEEICPECGHHHEHGEHHHHHGDEHHHEHGQMCIRDRVFIICQSTLQKKSFRMLLCWFCPILHCLKHFSKPGVFQSIPEKEDVYKRQLFQFIQPFCTAGNHIVV